MILQTSTDSDNFDLDNLENLVSDDHIGMQKTQEELDSFHESIENLLNQKQSDHIWSCYFNTKNTFTVYKKNSNYFLYDISNFIKISINNIAHDEKNKQISNCIHKIKNSYINKISNSFKSILMKKIVEIEFSVFAGISNKEDLFLQKNNQLLFQIPIEDSPFKNHFVIIKANIKQMIR